MLRGNHAAKIDDKGRLKIPNAFRALIEKHHGTELFVTSLTGEYVRLYPMPVWLAHEEKLARMPSTHPARLKYLDRVNYYGQTAQIDIQGRVVIHPRLRDSAGMVGDVDVFGQIDYARRLESRAVRRAHAARHVWGRRRAGVGGVRDLIDERPPRASPCLRNTGPARAVARRSLCRLHAWTRRPQPCPARWRGGADSRPRSRTTALELAAANLASFGDRVELVHSDYRDLPKVLDARGIATVAGALADLGVSSMQLGEGRGFSFQRDEPLDMRMDRSRRRRPPI